MLRTIPKHKGTDKMQADIKRRIARIKEAGEAARKKGKQDPYRVEREGAGSIVIGPPNSGKSALVGKLTSAKVVVAPYAFATTQPVPGMMKYEDILIQLVDTPPISIDNCPPTLMASIRSGDAVIMVVDVSSDSCLDDIQSLLELLDERKVVNQGKPHMMACRRSICWELLTTPISSWRLTPTSVSSGYRLNQQRVWRSCPGPSSTCSTSSGYTQSRLGRM